MREKAGRENYVTRDGIAWEERLMMSRDRSNKRLFSCRDLVRDLASAYS